MLLRFWVLAGIAVVSPAQSFTTLSSFNGTNGSTPAASVVQGADGNFYGTTNQGGANNYGTIFKVTPAGTLTTLYSFTNGANGSDPQAALIQATDGNFYGITGNGGADNGGTIFKITPGGALTTLHSFSGPDGYVPAAGLIQGTDGNFYGTTYSGGAHSSGTVFKITSGGTLTTMYSFTGAADGAAPEAVVIQATDGNFYGTTSAGGGVSGTAYGTVFKLTPGGALTTLYTFTGAGGQTPYSGLIQATDGNFYGTTSGGGGHSAGTVFKITPGGTLTTVYSFTNGGDGSGPQAGLVEGADGNLYGTAQYGGANNDGTVFKLQLGLPSSSSTPVITLVQNAEGGASTIAPNTWVTLKGSNLAPSGDSRTWQTSDFVNNELPTQLDGVSVTLNGEKAYVYYISPTQINILTPPDLATGTVQMQAATSAGTSASLAAQAQAESPSFFIIGVGPYVVATHVSGSLIGPASLYPGQTTPAQPGETIVLYANGFGPTATPVVSGSETQSGSLNPLPVVTIGGTPAAVQFAGLISPGLFQFNIVVPASTPSGDNALAATYGSLTTQSGVLVTIAP